MAVSLVLASPLQSNDATTIRIQDSTGDYDAVDNTGGWGTPNHEITDIVGPSVSNPLKYHLTLDVTITTSNGTATTYDTIDLYTEYGPFSTITDLVFDINPSILEESGVALGEATDQLPDGWYVFTYKLIYSDNHSLINSESVTVLIDGIVRSSIYDELRQLPYAHDFEHYTKDIEEWKTLVEPLYHLSLFEGMLSRVSYSTKEDILEILSTLENLLNS